MRLKKYRVFHLVLDLCRVDFDFFCQIPVCPSRIGQTVEQPKSKSTQPNPGLILDGTPCILIKKACTVHLGVLSPPSPCSKTSTKVSSGFAHMHILGAAEHEQSLIMSGMSPSGSQRVQLGSVARPIILAYRKLTSVDGGALPSTWDL